MKIIGPSADCWLFWRWALSPFSFATDENCNECTRKLFQSMISILIFIRTQGISYELHLVKNMIEVNKVLNLSAFVFRNWRISFDYTKNNYEECDELVLLSTTTCSTPVSPEAAHCQSASVPKGLSRGLSPEREPPLSQPLRLTDNGYIYSMNEFESFVESSDSLSLLQRNQATNLWRIYQIHKV